MRTTITFLVDDRPVEIDFSRGDSIRPTTTLLEYLRSLPAHRGTKEGCAEGDCGACTVVIAEPSGDGGLRYRAVDSCLLFLPMIDGKQVITIENLRSPRGDLHPVQEAMVRLHGSQCGFCTPGVVMSLFALYKRGAAPRPGEIEDALTGNLCRCTGYRPIVDAARDACARGPRDHLSEGERRVRATLAAFPHDSVSLRVQGQSYLRPVSLDDACRALEEMPGATVLTGATDVALRVTKRHEMLKTVIDLGAVEELKYARKEGGGMQIGAGAPLSDLPPVLGETYPALTEALSVFGSLQVRNCATLGGNLGTASPVGDLPPVLIAYGASVQLRSLRGSRSVPLDDFLTGYRKTLREPGELITSVRLPAPDGSLVRSYKISRRRDLDIATLSAGFRLRLNGKGVVESLTLAYGGMADRTKRAERAEAFLTGKSWSRELVEEAAEPLRRDFSPISDVRGSAEFRSLAARNVLLKFWLDSKD